MKTVPIVTDESKSFCHQLNVLLVDDVPDAKRKMHPHSADTLRGNGQVVPYGWLDDRIRPHIRFDLHRFAATLRDGSR